MSVSQRPSIPSLIPESAPFTPEQRTWLNGLIAGLFGLPENVTLVSSADASKLLAGLLDGAGGLIALVEADDGAPWHDPVMPLPDRMKLAEGADASASHRSANRGASATCSRPPAGPLARQSGLRHLPLAPPAQQAGL
jgi:hypothetical protein